MLGCILGDETMGQGIKDGYRFSGDRAREGDDLLDRTGYLPAARLARVDGMA